MKGCKLWFSSRPSEGGGRENVIVLSIIDVAIVSVFWPVFCIL